MAECPEREAYIREYLRYDPESPTGLRWMRSPLGGKKAGEPAFTAKNPRWRYYVGSCKGKLLRAHRVVWFLVHGEWPDQVDHINGDRNDNRIENLRAATSQINNQNRTARGYILEKRTGKYRAQIKTRGVTTTLGYFATPEEARAAYLEAKKIHHPTAPERCYA